MKQFNERVNSQSGLLSVAETSFNKRGLLQHEADDVLDRAAVSFVCFQVKKWIGSFGGLDTLVFADGIRENTPIVHACIR